MAASPSRLLSLDALRGLAALAVVLFHYLPYYDKLYGHHFALPPVLAETLLFGRYGVHLFFILSGFVILMTLERTRTAGWFGLARAFRLLPALWIGIALTFVTVQLLGPEDRAVSLGSALLNATLMHEYLGAPHVDGAYWSLVIEVTFYAWMALLFYGLGGDWQRLRVALWLWLAISYAGVIAWKALPGSLEFLIKDLLFVKYAPLFIGGMVLYRGYRGRLDHRADQLLLMLAIGHAFMAYQTPYALFVAGCYAVFALAAAGRLPWLAKPPLLWLGRLSYCLYLVHQNIGYAIIDLSYHLGLPGPAAVALALATAIALASLMHHAVERPALSWFRQYRERKRPQPRTAAP